MEINTKAFAEQWKEQLRIEIKHLKSTPKLLIIMAERYYEPSKKYVSNKMKVANELGIEVALAEVKWSGRTKEELLFTLENIISKHEGYSIIVQLPFPQLTEEDIAKLIPTNADVDGFTNEQKGLLVSGSDKALVPCTALGVIKLLEYVHGDLTGKSIAIFNRSNLIGKPLMQLALQKNMTPTVLHTKSAEYEKEKGLEETDIIVTGCGKRKMFNSCDIDGSFVETIIDCSMDRVDGIPGVGDFDKEDILNHYSNINIASGYGHTGTLTVIALCENVIKSHKLMMGK
jgi:methylenetetrahydrofolate dehydrogenase (NADP+)/methenyltetrahydrofolate cyclohydrolase